MSARPLALVDPRALAFARMEHALRLSSGFYPVVPCNGCTLCCHGDAIRILPHEDASKWQTVPHPFAPGALMLDHKPNGDCLYLGESGCTIHTDKPQQCVEMDCRNIARSLTGTQARKLDARAKAGIGGVPITIWRRGRELLGEPK